MPPLNDNFANAIDLGSARWGSTTGTTVDATVEAGEPDATAHPGETKASIWWDWTCPAGVTSVTFNTKGSLYPDGSEIYPVLAIWTGASLASLSLVAVHDAFYDSGLTTAGAFVTFTPVPGVTYRIQYENYADDSTGSVVLSWGSKAAGLSICGVVAIGRANGVTITRDLLGHPDYAAVCILAPDVVGGWTWTEHTFWNPGVGTDDFLFFEGLGGAPPDVSITKNGSYLQAVAIGVSGLNMGSPGAARRSSTDNASDSDHIGIDDQTFRMQADGGWMIPDWDHAYFLWAAYTNLSVATTVDIAPDAPLVSLAKLHVTPGGLTHLVGAGITSPVHTYTDIGQIVAGVRVSRFTVTGDHPAGTVYRSIALMVQAIAVAPTGGWVVGHGVHW